VNLPDYPDGYCLNIGSAVTIGQSSSMLCAITSIERVAMMGGEAIESEQVIKGDWEMLNPVFRQFAQHVWTGRPRERQLARLYLDKNLPDTCHAQRKIGGPAKMSRARRDILASPASATRTRACSRRLSFRKKRSVVEQVLNFRIGIIEVVRNREVAFGAAEDPLLGHLFQGH